MAGKKFLTMVAMMVVFVASVSCEPVSIVNDDYEGFAVEGNTVYAFRNMDDGEIFSFKLNPIRLVDDPVSVSDTTVATDAGLIQVAETFISSTQFFKDLGISGYDKNIEFHAEIFTAKMSVPVQGAENLNAEISFVKDVVYLVLEDEKLCQELDFSYEIKGVPIAVELTNEGYLNYKYQFDLEVFESGYSIGAFRVERVFAVSPAE